MTTLQREALAALVSIAVAHTIDHTAERWQPRGWTAKEIAGRMGHSEFVVASALGRLAASGFARKLPGRRSNTPLWRPTAAGTHEVLRSHPPLGG